MVQAIAVVDSFTDTPFSGNPAGVCVLGAPTTEAWMQAVAAELNVAETAFLVPRSDGDHDLRWFSPTTEIELCGHATLASAHVLGGAGRFHTRHHGVLTCWSGTAPGTVAMDFPAVPSVSQADPPDWAGALGLPGDRVADVRAGGGWTLVEVRTPADVRAAVPDHAEVAALADAVCVAAAPGDRAGVDSVCRVFAGGVGNDEDPVTGSAHCMIALWLAARTGATAFTGEQASPRGGRVGMRLDGERVVLSGAAVTVWKGTLLADPPPG